MEFFFLDWHFHINRWTFVPNYFGGGVFCVFRVQFHQGVQSVCAVRRLAHRWRGLDREKTICVHHPAFWPDLHCRTTVRTLDSSIIPHCLQNNLWLYVPVLTRFFRQEKPFKGVWVERPLMFSEIKKEDFDVNYTCRADSARGKPLAYFTLRPSGKTATTT